MLKGKLGEDCYFRERGAVQCDGGECGKCGWHPEVEEQRKAKIRGILNEPSGETWSIGSGSFDKNILS